MQGMPDLLDNTENTESVAPQNMAAAATVNGAAVDLENREMAVVELHLGSLTGAPTGGTVTLTIQEAPDNNGSPGAWNAVVDPDIGALTIVGNYNDTLPEILRQRYKGGAAGKLRWLRASITTALTGGTTPTANVSANVLKGGLRFAGKQPTAGSAPQTPGGAITN